MNPSSVPYEQVAAMRPVLLMPALRSLFDTFTEKLTRMNAEINFSVDERFAPFLPAVGCVLLLYIVAGSSLTGGAGLFGLPIALAAITRMNRGGVIHHPKKYRGSAEAPPETRQGKKQTAPRACCLQIAGDRPFHFALTPGKLQKVLDKRGRPAYNTFKSFYLKCFR